MGFEGSSAKVCMSVPRHGRGMDRTLIQAREVLEEYQPVRLEIEPRCRLFLDLPERSGPKRATNPSSIFHALPRSHLPLTQPVIVQLVLGTYETGKWITGLHPKKGVRPVAREVRVLARVATDASAWLQDFGRHGSEFKWVFVFVCFTLRVPFS